MRKVIIFSCIVVSVVGIILNSKTSASFLGKATAIAVASHGQFSRGDEQEIGKFPDIKVSRVSYDFEKVQTLSEIEHELQNHTPAELNAVLSESKQVVQRLGLIEKANSGSISDQEAQQLTLEMRRQTVVHKIIIDKLLDGEDGRT